MAGLAGADVREAGESGAGWVPIGGGVLCPLARTQYAALATMRWQAFRNGLHSTRGALEAAASGLNYLLYGFMALGITAGLGGGAYYMASKGQWLVMPVLLWALFAMWQMMPLVMAASQQQFDLNGLLRFPMGFAPFFVLHVVFGLIDSSTIFGALGCFGIWAGVTLADPGLFGWAAAAMAVFAVFNLLLSRAVFAWFDRWLGQRKTREVMSVLFFAVLLGLQFLNPALREKKHPKQVTERQRATLLRNLAWAETAQSWLPPGLGIATLERADGGQPAAALGYLSLLGLYGLGAGLLLSVRLRAEHRGENLSDASAVRGTERRANGVSARESAGGLAALGGSGPIGAMIEKDARTMIRSLPLLYAIGAPLLMVLVLASLLHGTRFSHGGAFPVALPLCIAYAALGFTQLIYNNLGTEGAGIQLLFLSPTPMRTVLLAKNIFHAMLFVLVALTAGVLTVLRLGAPSAPWLAATAAWLVFALPAHLTVGNILSLTMPHRVNLSRVGRHRGGQAIALFSMLVQLGILAVGAATVGLCLLFGDLWLATPVLLALAVVTFIVWLRVLANADAMANRHRDELLAALVKTD